MVGTRFVHRNHKAMSATLSKELRKECGCRSLSVRKGDKVKILRGDFKGMEGEVIEVHPQKQRIEVEKVATSKADGTEVSRPIHASNVAIVSLASDKTRDEILKRRSARGKERSAEAS